MNPEKLAELQKQIARIEATSRPLRVNGPTSQALARWAVARIYARVKDLEPCDRFVDPRGTLWLYHGANRAQPYGRDGFPMAGVLVTLPGDSLVVRRPALGQRPRR